MDTSRNLDTLLPSGRSDFENESFRGRSLGKGISTSYFLIHLEARRNGQGR